MNSAFATLRAPLAAGIILIAAGALLPHSASAEVLVADVPHAAMLDRGALPADAPVRLTIVLRYRNASALDRLIEEQGDPASPLYGHYLSPAQFRASFAPEKREYARVLSLFERAGFAVAATFANRTVIDVAAPASLVERFFHTELRRVSIDGRDYYANARPAYAPETLRASVSGIDGFDDVAWFHGAVRSGAAIPPLSVGVGDMRVGRPLRSPAPWYALGPLAFAEGYDLPVQHQIPGQPAGTTYDGTGRVTGIINASDPSDGDLAAFLSYYKIARTGSTSRVPIDGGPGNYDEVGATLNYETVASLAPGTDITIYEVPELDLSDLLDALNASVTDDVADAVELSFGACETDHADPLDFANLIKQGTSQGQTFDAASGIGGPFASGCSNVSVNVPASAPQAVAVGGTTYNVLNNGKYFGEDYWDAGGLAGAGGGGVSVVFALPKWQANVPNIVASGRNLPDVSFDADVDTGEEIVIGGAWYDIGPVGGTALSAAIFAACATEADQVAGKRLPSMTESLYERWLKKGNGSGGSTRVHDVTTGVPWTPLIPRPGYDLATGLGSLDCYNAGRTLF
jgi:subtilase family serine protease